MVTRQQLQALNLAEVTTAADGWGALLGMMEAARVKTDQGIAKPVRAEQAGDAANAMQDRLSQLSQNYQYVSQESGYLRSVLAALVDELTPVRKSLLDALAEAEQRGFTVEADGSVSYPTDTAASVPFALQPAGSAAPGAPEPLFISTAQNGHNGENSHHAAAVDLANRIATAVTKATEIDERFARTLAKSKSQPGYRITDATWAEVAADGNASRAIAAKDLHLDAIPPNKDPKATAQWWKSLSEEQREEYISLYPDRIGALDGLPAATRDQANRVVLREQRAILVEQDAQLGPCVPEPPKHDPRDARNPAPSIEWQRWNEREKLREALEQKLQGIDAIQQRLDSAGSTGPDRLDAGPGGLPDAYLLAFDATGHGRAVVARGNPDTAAHTAVYVPGTGARLAEINGDLNRSDRLWARSNQLSTGASVSTITWLGYDAPQNLLTDSPFRSYADAAAPDLDRFTDGLRVAHPGPATHLTLVGHSYGTTVIGSAAIHGRLDANDIVVAGSPGMEVTNASDLGVGSEHVWAEGAAWDPVPIAGKLFSNLPRQGFDPVYDHGIPYGFKYAPPVVPTDPSFGGNIMTTDTSGHSGYWNPNSRSLNNQAAVITGNYSRVRHAS